MRVAVSGANGFIGQELARRLAQINHLVLALGRRSLDFKDTAGIIPVLAPNLLTHSDGRLLAAQGIDVLVHCAARVHVMNDVSSDPVAEFHRVNVEGTANIARQAAAARVRRFIFLSSIKVNGESTEPGCPFTADDVPAPEGPYGVSKYEAERVLRQIGADTGMEVVIIRLPLVYGPGVKGNFESMMQWLERGLPLPIASITENRRSLVALGNLVDLVVTCLNHRAAAEQTFLVSDGEDLSTADLLRRMGVAMGHPARLFQMPPPLLKFGAKMVNKSSIYQRLSGSLQVDISKTRQLLGWTPTVSVDQGLLLAAQGFCS